MESWSCCCWWCCPHRCHWWPGGTIVDGWHGHGYGRARTGGSCCRYLSGRTCQQLCSGWIAIWRIWSKDDWQNHGAVREGGGGLRICSSSRYVLRSHRRTTPHARQTPIAHPINETMIGQTSSMPATHRNGRSTVFEYQLASAAGLAPHQTSISLGKFLTPVPRSHLHYVSNSMLCFA